MTQAVNEFSPILDVVHNMVKKAHCAKSIATKTGYKRYNSFRFQTC